MKNKIIRLLFCVVILFGLMSCSKTKKMEKNLPAKNAELLYVVLNRSGNDYTALFYCDDLEKLPDFLKSYDCTDVDEWNFNNTTENGKFFTDINSSLRALEDKGIEKDLKSGCYVKMYLKLWDDGIEIVDCNAYYVQFSMPITTTTLNVATMYKYDNLIELEYSSRNHDINKKICF